MKKYKALGVLGITVLVAALGVWKIKGKSSKFDTYKQAQSIEAEKASQKAKGEVPASRTVLAKQLKAMDVPGNIENLSELVDDVAAIIMRGSGDDYVKNRRKQGMSIPQNMEKNPDAYWTILTASTRGGTLNWSKAEIIRLKEMPTRQVSRDGDGLISDLKPYVKSGTAVIQTLDTPGWGTKEEMGLRAKRRGDALAVIVPAQVPVVGVADATMTYEIAKGMTREAYLYMEFIQRGDTGAWIHSATGLLGLDAMSSITMVPIP